MGARTALTALGIALLLAGCFEAAPDVEDTWALIDVGTSSLHRAEDGTVVLVEGGSMFGCRPTPPGVEVWHRRTDADAPAATVHDMRPTCDPLSWDLEVPPDPWSSADLSRLAAYQAFVRDGSSVHDGSVSVPWNDTVFEATVRTGRMPPSLITGTTDRVPAALWLTQEDAGLRVHGKGRMAVAWTEIHVHDHLEATACGVVADAGMPALPDWRPDHDREWIEAGDLLVLDAGPGPTQTAVIYDAWAGSVTEPPCDADPGAILHNAVSTLERMLYGDHDEAPRRLVGSFHGPADRVPAQALQMGVPGLEGGVRLEYTWSDTGHAREMTWDGHAYAATCSGKRLWAGHDGDLAEQHAAAGCGETLRRIDPVHLRLPVMRAPRALPDLAGGFLFVTNTDTGKARVRIDDQAVPVGAMFEERGHHGRFDVLPGGSTTPPEAPRAPMMLDVDVHATADGGSWFLSSPRGPISHAGDLELHVRQPDGDVVLSQLGPTPRSYGSITATASVPPENTLAFGVSIVVEGLQEGATVDLWDAWADAPVVEGDWPPWTADPY